MAYREQQYVIRFPDGKFLGKCTREVQVFPVEDTKEIRTLGGARARRWIKRHPGLGGEVIPDETV